MVPTMVEIRYNKELQMMELKVPYNKEFIQKLKDSIRYPFRKWNAEEKVWLISLSHKNILVPLIEEYYPEEEILFIGEFPTTYHFYDDNEYYELLEIRPDCSNEVLKSAYRALCKKYHPDLNHGVDKTTMQELSNAYEELKSMRGI